MPVYISDTSACDDEDRLLNTLFTPRYNTFSRPVKKHTDVLDVSFGVAIRQIVQVVWHTDPWFKL